MSSICFRVAGKRVVQGAPNENHSKKTRKKWCTWTGKSEKQTCKFYYLNASWGGCIVMVKQVNMWNMLIVGTILQILTVAFVLLMNKEEPNHMWICLLFLIKTSNLGRKILSRRNAFLINTASMSIGFLMNGQSMSNCFLRVGEDR